MSLSPLTMQLCSSDVLSKNIHVISQIQRKSAPRFGVSSASRDEVQHFARRHTEEGQEKHSNYGFQSINKNFSLSA